MLSDIRSDMGFRPSIDCTAVVQAEKEAHFLQYLM